MAQRQLNGFRIETGDVTLITFNNAKANVFSTAVLEDFIKEIEALPAGVKVLVITAEGSTFMAGADIKELSGFSPVEAEGFARLFHRVLNAVEQFPRPVLAGVNGFALGGGCELVLASDLVVASESAVFGQPEVNIGIIPGAGGTQRLAGRVGRLRAKELIFTGKRIGAAEALDIGLVNRVVPGERLMEEVAALAKTIASKPVQCVEAAKSLIDRGSFDKEIETFSSMFSYADQKRLMGDFLGKKERG